MHHIVNEYPILMGLVSERYSCTGIQSSLHPGAKKSSVCVCEFP